MADLTDQRKHFSDWVPIILLTALVLAVFWPACGHEFLDWDDVNTIARHPNFNPPTFSHLLRYWRESYFDLYIPVTYTVWFAAAALARTPDDVSGIALNPYVFHALNLVLHLGAACLVFAVLRQLVSNRWAAWVGAVVFALHPLQVEAVAWVSGMKDVLSALLCLWATWHYTRFAKIEPAPQTERIRRTHYVIAIFAFVLAMLAKPSAVTLPLALAAIDLGILRRKLADVAGALAPFVMLIAPIIVIAKSAQPAPPLAAALPAWWRIFVALDALAFYLRKLVLPFHLTVDYGRSPAWLMAHRQMVLWCVLPVVLTVGLVLARRRARWALVAGGVFLAGVLPVLGLVRFDFQDYSTVADHYVYFAMLGPAIAAAFVVGQLSRRAAVGISICVIAALALLSHVQTQVWRDTATLFQQTLNVNPSSAAALNNLGFRLEQDGQLDEAAKYYQTAIDAHPDDPSGYVNLASVRGKQNQFDREAELCRRALAAQPNYAKAHYNLAFALMRLRRNDEAVAEYQKAIELQPQWAEARSNLGAVYMIEGRFAEAGQQFLAALRLDPNLTAARRGLAAATDRLRATSPSSQPNSR